MALHITDGHPRHPVPHREGVVEVTSYRQTVLRGRVPGCQADAREIRQSGGEHVPLQRHAELCPGPLQPDVLQCLIDKTTESDKEFLGAVRRFAVSSVHDIPAIPIRPW